MKLLQTTRECRTAALRHWPGTRDGKGPVAPAHKRSERSIRLFQNDFIERWLAQAHPITPILWFGPFIVWGLYRGVTRTPWLWPFLLVLGYLAWTLLEYVLHRFVFHMQPDNQTERERTFMLHGYHHEFPRDSMRLVAPPLMSWPGGAALFALIWFGLGPLYGPPVFAGVSLGYVAYDWIHYAMHHFKPRLRVFKWLTRYHLLHHYDEAHLGTRFGVSTPLWDFVFGTYRPTRASK